MRYSNPPVSTLDAPESETREFLVLSGVVTAIVLFLVLGTALAASWLAPLVPFRVEQALAAGPVGGMLDEGEPTGSTAAVEAELERVTGRLVEAMGLPPEMEISVHYVDSPTVNAAATLGGHLFVFRGLLEKLDSEDALAAVIAHEIGHVRHRHVIAALGRGVAAVAALQAIGIRNQGLANWAIGEGARLTSLSFSRDAEREADIAALEAVHQVYGHVGGIDDLFAVIEDISGGGLEVMKSHPMPEQRRAALRALALERGYALQGERRPMAEAITAALPSAGETGRYRTD